MKRHTNAAVLLAVFMALGVTANATPVNGIPGVPDAGSTSILLGMGVLGLRLISKRVR